MKRSLSESKTYVPHIDCSAKFPKCLGTSAEYKSCLDWNAPLSFEKLESKLINASNRILANDLTNILHQRAIIMNKNQYQLQNHLQQSQVTISRIMDKINVWVADNITQRQSTIEFQKSIEAKQKRIEKKCQKTVDLISKISEKLVQKKLQEMRRRYKIQIQKQRPALPRNPQLQITRSKLNLLSERCDKNYEIIKQKHKLMMEQICAWRKK